MSDSVLPPLPEGVPLRWVSPPCKSFSTVEPAAPRRYFVQMQTGHGGKARAFSVVFECPLANIAAIRSQLAHAGIVSGTKLLLEDGPGGRTIVGRIEFAFGAAGLVSVEPYERRLVEGVAA